jgi:TolA-binding protein
MTKRRFTVFILIFFLLSTSVLFSKQLEEGLSVLNLGIENFKKSVFNEAILSFREIIQDPDLEVIHGDAYYWLTKAYMALNRLEDAEKHLEYFLLNFPEHRYFEDLFYQKGRLFYLQNDYQSAIQVFQTFIDTFENSPFIANTYYWIGECLYALGHLNEALIVFNTVVVKYPTSFRVEPAKYRIAVIELKYREEELLKLLKWSHEESLKSLEEFQKKEKTYKEAIKVYQTKLASLATEDFQGEITNLSEQIDTLTKELTQKESETDKLANENATLKNTIANYEGKISQLEKMFSEARKEVTESSRPVTDNELAQLAGDIESKIRLVKIKEEALVLKDYYMNWLRDNSGSAE